MLPLLSGSKNQNESFRFEISDSSHVGEVRRFAGQLARQNDFDETTAGRLSIVLNELVTNVLKHATRGEIILRVDEFTQPGTRSIEILCLDRGSGLPDIKLCFEDGFSTSSTSGTGLGAIRRQSDQFDLFTNSQGTVIFSSLQIRPEGFKIPVKEHFYVGGICIPVEGETECGDGWFIRHDGHRAVLLVADGLGHGLLAHKAAEAAIETLRNTEHPTQLPILMQEIHAALRSTRGAAVALCCTDLQTKALEYMSIGNVRTVVNTIGEPKSLLSHAGTLGLQFKAVRPQMSQVQKEARLIVHTDGLTQRWSLQEYPGLQMRHPAVIAGVLYRDFTRGKDDVTVLVGGWVA